MGNPGRAKFRARWYHWRAPNWLCKDRVWPEGLRARPETVYLGVPPGVAASRKPTVRIFVGSEPAQHRAERVFVWSVLRARDPAREYEIHLMKDLAGFDRKGWKTGFANYCYAIPHLEGGVGRAIYNDVDQIYLADPAELFDLDMAGAGVLGITGREASVMLIDRARMGALWPLERAKHGGRHNEFRDATLSAGLWGELSGEWNRHDGERRAGVSKCFHFTSLQRQPWQPFPDQFRYGPHPDGEVWLALERAADAVGFTIFTKERPSRRFAVLLEQYRLLHDRGEARLAIPPERTFDGHSLARHVRVVAALIRETGARTLLDYGAGKGCGYAPFPGEPADGPVKEHPAWSGVSVTCYDPGYSPFAAPYQGPFDGVISTDVLEHIPDDDIGWVLDELFAAARRFVYVGVACYPARKSLPNGENAHCTLQPPAWWRSQLDLAARRRPGIAWTLCTEERGRLGMVRRVARGDALPAKKE